MDPAVQVIGHRASFVPKPFTKPHPTLFHALPSPPPSPRNYSPHRLTPSPFSPPPPPPPILLNPSSLLPPLRSRAPSPPRPPPFAASSSLARSCRYRRSQIVPRLQRVVELDIARGRESVRFWRHRSSEVIGFYQVTRPVAFCQSTAAIPVARLDEDHEAGRSAGRPPRSRASGCEGLPLVPWRATRSWSHLSSATVVALARGRVSDADRTRVGRLADYEFHGLDAGGDLLVGAPILAPPPPADPGTVVGGDRAGWAAAAQARHFFPLLRGHPTPAGFEAVGPKPRVSGDGPRDDNRCRNCNFEPHTPNARATSRFAGQLWGGGDFLGVSFMLRHLAYPYAVQPFESERWQSWLRSPIHEHRMLVLVIMAERGAAPADGVIRRSRS